MEDLVKGPIIAVVGIIVLLLVVNIGISIYEPTAVKNAIKSTTTQNYTVNSVEYELEGTGESAEDEAQAVHDNVNTIRTIANVLLGLVFLVVIVLAAVSLFKRKHY
jgi:hypothetical protein